MLQARTYRKGLQRRLPAFRVVVEQTDLWIQADQPLMAVARESVLHHRHQLEGFIRRFPGFASSMEPWPLEGPAPPIVRRMCAAASRARVGPMAAVAGAVAAAVGEDLLGQCNEVVVENGGDVFIKNRERISIAIYAGGSPLSMRVGLQFAAAADPFGVCTSSGTVGHSRSLGAADAVCVVAPCCALADAAATAIGNHVRRAGDIPAGIDLGMAMGGLDGIVIIVGERMGVWGKLQVVPLPGKKGLSFKGKKSR
ncbi:MAG: UPF0280 family protein [Desulfobacteraceae bacterium]|jgi:hypothetical protein|nr:UPF0280 family protein [Desulfobacteraceae bacterium]